MAIDYEVRADDILEITTGGEVANFNHRGDLTNSSQTETVYYMRGETAPTADDARQVGKGRIPPLGTLRITQVNSTESRVAFITASAPAILDFSAV